MESYRVVVLACTAFGCPTAGVLTNYNNNSRTGSYFEAKLRPANVDARHFGLLSSKEVDGLAHAQPLYYRGLRMQTGTFNVVIVATENNTVYAFDADSSSPSYLWRRNLTPSNATTHMCTQKECGGCNLFGLGITSTPVIDSDSQTLYVVAKTTESGKKVYRLHALSLVDGTSTLGSPKEITAVVPGTGAGASLDPNNPFCAWTTPLANQPGATSIPFNPQFALNRAALLLQQGVLYIAFGNICDGGCMHGWLFAYDARTLSQRAVFNSTPDGWAGGIWQSGRGPAGDGMGVYFATGNGWGPGSDDNEIKRNGFNVDKGGRNIANTVVRLTLQGNALPVPGEDGRFTPCNQDQLSFLDWDIASAGPMLIPGTNLLLASGKQGIFYLLDRANLGGFRGPPNHATPPPTIPASCTPMPDAACDDPQVVDRLKAANGHVHGSPVVWARSDDWLIYVWSEQDRLKAIRLAVDNQGIYRFDRQPYSQSAVPILAGMPGGMLAHSSEGPTPNTGIVWATHPAVNTCDLGDGEFIVPGILHAFDAGDLSRELWNSQMDKRDDLGMFAKFSPPTVADGKVFVMSSPPAPQTSGYLRIYGLLPQVRPVPCPTLQPTDGALCQLNDSSVCTYKLVKCLCNRKPSVVATCVNGRWSVSTLDDPCQDEPLRPGCKPCQPCP
jgi:hypothetical protein